MIKLNNKGQSLVMFILILPILLLLFVIVIDIGNALINKQELDNINCLTIEYGLDHINENSIQTKLIDMINLNDLKLSEINVKVENNKIYITTKKNINGILAKGFKIVTIESKYQGYIKEGKKVIEKVWIYG